MPELSDRQREQAAQLAPKIAGERLVACLEYGWDIEVRCLACGTARTWRRPQILGRLRPYLNATLTQIQAKAVCRRCGAHRPKLLAYNGAYKDGPIARSPAAAGRRRACLLLLEAGLTPSAYGYGTQPGPR